MATHERAEEVGIVVGTGKESEEEQVCEIKDGEEGEEVSSPPPEALGVVVVVVVVRGEKKKKKKKSGTPSARGTPHVHLFLLLLSHDLVLDRRDSVAPMALPKTTGRRNETEKVVVVVVEWEVVVEGK